jgi:hypothetical protein
VIIVGMAFAHITSFHDALPVHLWSKSVSIGIKYRGDINVSGYCALQLDGRCIVPRCRADESGCEVWN